MTSVVSRPLVILVTSLVVAAGCLVTDPGPGDLISETSLGLERAFGIDCDFADAYGDQTISLTSTNRITRRPTGR